MLTGWVFGGVVQMDSIFREELLVQELQSFAKDVIEQLEGLGTKAKITEEKIRLLLNDKEIRLREDIETSNGRYYFRKDQIWKSCYIPYTGNQGVYFFFDKHAVALYVGKSETTIGKAVARHVGKYENGSFPELAFPEAEYVIVIPFETGPFLAPAFESYLLSKYKFKYNTVGQ